MVAACLAPRGTSGVTSQLTLVITSWGRHPEEESIKDVRIQLSRLVAFTYTINRSGRRKLVQADGCLRACVLKLLLRPSCFFKSEGGKGNTGDEGRGKEVRIYLIYEETCKSLLLVLLN